jgi:hypothetical protein
MDELTEFALTGGHKVKWIPGIFEVKMNYYKPGAKEQVDCYLCFLIINAL